MNARSIGIAAACSLLCFSAFAQGGDPSVSASGEALVKENSIQARADALNAAMTAALQAAAARFLPSSVVSETKDVLAKKIGKDPSVYILDYKPVHEETDGGKIRLEVSAIPRTEKLRDDLARWGILFDRPRRPKIGLYELKGNNTEWTKRIAKRLIDFGYTVEELTQGQDRRGDGIPCDFAVSGSVAVHGDKSISASLQISGLNPRADLAEMRGSFSLGEGADLAAGLLASAILENALPAWFRSLGGGKEYSVMIAGLASYGVYKSIRDYFNSGRDGFSSAREEMYAPGRVSFRVVFDGPSTELVKALAANPLQGIRFRVKEAMEASVSVEIQ